MLLDTCTLLWLASTPTALPGNVRRVIADNARNLFISAITAFEIGIKHLWDGRPTTPEAAVVV